MRYDAVTSDADRSRNSSLRGNEFRIGIQFQCSHERQKAIQPHVCLAAQTQMRKRNASTRRVWNRRRQRTDRQTVIVDNQFAGFARRSLEINSSGSAIRLATVADPAKRADLGRIECGYALIIDGNSTSASTATSEIYSRLPSLTVGTDLSGSRQGPDIDPDCATASTTRVSGGTTQSIGRNDPVKIDGLRYYADQPTAIAADRTRVAAAAAAGIVWISKVAVDSI